MLLHRVLLLIVAATSVTCRRSATPLAAPITLPSQAPMAKADPDRQILHTTLIVDVTSHRGRALLRLEAKESFGVSLDIGAIAAHESVDLAARGLVVQKVELDDGRALSFAVVVDASSPARKRLRLDVGIPDRPGVEPTVVIEYLYRDQDARDDGAHEGAFVEQGRPGEERTYTWPWFCGNLFPCRADFATGSTYALTLEGVPGGMRAIYPPPPSIALPSYAPAWSIGRYVYRQLGVTQTGTEVGVFHFEGDEALVEQGTRALFPAFAWIERNIGRYAVAGKAVVVEVRASDGLEHHPYWHVGEHRFGEVDTHVHEALHGWFSVGVRLRCFEDFVLSEGTVDYLTAKALEGIGDPIAKSVWAGYASDLHEAMNDTKSARELRAWPGAGTTCGDWDPARNFNAIPYTKGAFFYRAVERKIGEAALLAILGNFYREHQGQAASMREMIDAIRNATKAATTPIDVETCARMWLTERALPPGDPLDVVCP